jgi:hypothetical protein
MYYKVYPVNRVNYIPSATDLTTFSANWFSSFVESV